jgi:hypothetical protein
MKRREFITLLGDAAVAFIAVAALAAIFIGVPPVAAQDYPARPITLVVPFPARRGGHPQGVQQDQVEARLLYRRLFDHRQNSLRCLYRLRSSTHSVQNEL